MLRAWRVLGGFLCLWLAANAYAAPLGQPSVQIHVDQFGYLPALKKVAVIAEAALNNANASGYQPGTMFEIRRSVDNRVVLRSQPSVWRQGAVHAQSGDRVWWFDFSALTQTGEYYVYDPSNALRSDSFRIGVDVYRSVLQQATRMFFYQRCGHAKQQPFADARWADSACHLADRRARDVHAPHDAATERDLSGGWHDAGDYNKYTILTAETLSDLLFAFSNNRAIWADDFNLPESGNGVPDLLDEIKWELDWLLRMQNRDGSVLTKLSAADFQSAAPPSADATVRYYGAASTSATLAAAVSFAHAALVYREYMPAYAERLESAAGRAWRWAAAHPDMLFDNAGFGSESTEVNAYQRAMFKLAAAIYLSALTGAADYGVYVEAHLRTTHALQWDYWHCYEALLQDALWFYADLPNAPAKTAQTLRASHASALRGPDFLAAFQQGTDAYRAYLKDDCYTWGSNRLKSHLGLLFFQQATQSATDAALYREAGAQYLHYLHGVNPLGLVYLTNMREYGAANSLNEIFHRWFRNGSVWDNAATSPRGPAPGFLSGGPHRTFAPSPEYQGTLLTNLHHQPPQRAYLDWNGDWPENSWELTEPAIYYQAAYLHLLATTLTQYQAAPPSTALISQR
ncbi:MAG: glycoside hydrolase family 9 protein [Acidobacteria bacterium]|nr:glycoside hydrolase family 9 protein [Acidobacteriota bacterium]MBI3424487.1 glycoside hydrolase family 9 protein [Acidobacteriota bacterium]